MFNPNDFKAHPSAIGSIMPTPKGDGIVSVGTATILQKWAKEQIYGKVEGFNTSSKYTRKGVEMEAVAIDYLIKNTDLDWAMKNETTYENDFLIGTPDLVYPDLIVDIKCSYSCFTFPLFDAKPNPDYVWQLQGYMELTGARKAIVAYILMDASDEQIEAEAYALARKEGSELTDEIIERTAEQMRYEHLAPELRIKLFHVNYDPIQVEKIKDKVNDCRAYLKTLL